MDETTYKVVARSLTGFQRNATQALCNLELPLEGGFTERKALLALQPLEYCRGLGKGTAASFFRDFIKPGYVEAVQK